MNSIQALKLAGLGEAARVVGGAVKGFAQGAGHIGEELGGMVGGPIGKSIGGGVGQVAGYAAPLLAANYAANQFAPTRRAKAWLGEKMPVVGQRVGQALVPKDFGARPGDVPAYSGGYGGYY
jgi:hypothetical protein